MATAAAAALLTLAACGGSSGGSTSPTPSSSNLTGGGAGAAQDANAQAPAAAVPGAKKGGTINVVTYVSANSLDPTVAYYVDSVAILSNLVTRSLTQYIYKDGNMVLVPDMATNLGDVSSNGLTWTFTLRNGLKYENGKPVQAADIAYAIKRSFAQKELAGGPTYQIQYFKGGDKYQGPYDSGLNFPGVSTSGNKVIIHLSQPFPDLPYFVSFPMFTGIPQSADNMKNPTAYGDHPLATGPYMFKSYTPGQSLTLVKNPNWDPSTDPGRHQYADTWTFNWSQNQKKDDSELISNQPQFQTTLSYDNVLAADYRQATSQAANRVVTGSQPCTFFWYMDMNKIPDLKVRQAIGWAYPYKDAWKAAGEIVGVTRVPGTAILPPGIPGRINYQALPGQDGSVTDVKKAHALLASAGKLGFEIKWPYTTDDPTSVAAMQKVKASLQAAGFKASPVATTTDTIRNVLADQSADINIRTGGWCSDWPSGGSWFPPLFDGRQANKPGVPNKSNFNEPDFQSKLLANMKLPSTQAAPKWGELDKFMEQKYYPVVNTGYSAAIMLRGSKIGGMHINNTLGMPTFMDMFVSQ
ncbi:MAG: ABC transporter substrate-binding protein [Nocardioidaceae bacterium]